LDVELVPAAVQFTPSIKCQRAIDIEVPKKQYLSPILSTDMVQRLFRWEGQKRWYGKPARGPWQKNAKKKVNIFFICLVEAAGGYC